MINENINDNKNNVNYSNKLYAIMNITTGKLETKLTNPGHKFWEIKGHCKNALINYKKKYEKSSNKVRMVNPDDLKIVRFSLLLEEYENEILN